MSTANTSRSLTMKKSRTMDIEEDRLIDLPNEVLDTILSLLTAKEAATTCILSRRWKSMWDSSWRFRMNLNFDFNENEAWELTRQRSMFVAYVNRILDNHRATNIDQFRVSFDLDIGYRLQINNWIKFAMRKKAKVLQLHLLYDHPCRERYNFPKTLLGCQNFNFESLQVLEFKNVNVRGEIVEYLLSHCPVLERLIVHRSETLGELRVVGPSLKLKHLELQPVYKSLASLEIRNVPKLASFYLTGAGTVIPTIDLTINTVPKLVEVTIPATENCFHKLLACASQLLALHLCVWNQPLDSLPRQFPALTNLKHLELLVRFQMRWHENLSSILEACPSLQTIVFKMPPLEIHRHVRDDEWYPKTKMLCLKEVKILGYIGSQIDIALFNFFMNNAVSLQKFVVDTRTYYQELEDLEAEKNARTHAMKLLRPNVPSTVEFVCLS